MNIGKMFACFCADFLFLANLVVFFDNIVAVVAAVAVDPVIKRGLLFIQIGAQNADILRREDGISVILKRGSEAVPQQNVQTGVQLVGDQNQCVDTGGARTAFDVPVERCRQIQFGRKLLLC